MHHWTPFPYPGAYRFDAASLPDHWARLHRGDAEPLPTEPDVLRAWGQIVLDHAKTGKDMKQVWKDMGFTMTNGKDMTSVMYRMEGAPIYEQTLGSADAMLLRLLAGDETVGGTKDPYDPRIHFVLINEAYKAANPGNKQLADWLDANASAQHA